MEIDMTEIKMKELSVERESPKGIEEKEVAVGSAGEALPGLVGVANATDVSSGKAGPLRRNRNGSEKRKARKARMKASEELNPGPKVLLVSPEKGHQGTTGAR